MLRNGNPLHFVSIFPDELIDGERKDGAQTYEAFEPNHLKFRQIKKHPRIV